MKINELMVNDRIYIIENDVAVAKKVIGLKPDSVLLEDLVTKGFSISKPEGCTPIPITKENITKLSFSKRNIKADNQLNQSLNDDYISILENPENQDVFFLISLSELTSDNWKLSIQNKDYQSIGLGEVKYVHELQNFIKIITNLEIHTSI